MESRDEGSDYFGEQIDTRSLMDIHSTTDEAEATRTSILDNQHDGLDHSTDDITFTDLDYYNLLIVNALSSNQQVSEQRNSRTFITPPSNNPPIPRSETSTSNQQPSVCDVCGFSSKSRFHFNSHMNTHGFYNCSICGYMSRQLRNLKRHLQTSHYTENPNNTNQPLASDHSTTKRKSGKLYRCRKCPSVFENKEDYWQHLRLHIAPQDLWNCPDCEFCTKFYQHFQYHRFSTHLNAQRLQCSHCEYRCVSKSMLTSHLKSHNSYCAFRCADCSYESKYPSSFKQHQKKYGHRRLLQETSTTQSEVQTSTDNEVVGVIDLVGPLTTESSALGFDQGSEIPRAMTATHNEEQVDWQSDAEHATTIADTPGISANQHTQADMPAADEQVAMDASSESDGNVEQQDFENSSTVISLSNHRTAAFHSTVPVFEFLSSLLTKPTVIYYDYQMLGRFYGTCPIELWMEQEKSQLLLLHLQTDSWNDDLKLGDPIHSTACYRFELPCVVNRNSHILCFGKQSSGELAVQYASTMSQNMLLSEVVVDVLSALKVDKILMITTDKNREVVRSLGLESPPFVFV
ncbi:Protein hunchback-like protein [Aphelenchoides besseyi]|nr:Protein hunchback-like protein [Aphelenchoides besseyi]